MEVKDTALAVSNSGLISIETALPQDKIMAVLAVFDPYMVSISEMIEASKSIVVEDENDAEGMAAARAARLDLAKVRQECETARKNEKEFILLAGKAIDGISHIVQDPAKEEEARLKECEKFAEIAEQNRRDALRAERTEALAPYMSNGLEVSGLEDMTEEAFQDHLEMTRDAFEYRKMKEEKAEKERIEAEENARIEREAERARIAELEAKQAEADAKIAAAEAEAAQAREEAEQLNAILEQVEATPKFDEEQVVIYEIGKSSGRRELAIELSLLLPASDDKAIRTIAEYLKDVIEETEPAQ